MHELWNKLEPLSEGFYKGSDYGDSGQIVLDLCASECPGLVNLVKSFGDSKPFAGVRLSGCLHMTNETMTLIRAAVQLGAKVRWASSNPYSSNDMAVHAASKLMSSDVALFGFKGESMEEYFWCMYQSLVWPGFDGPLLLVDDGCCSYHMIHYGVLIEEMYEKEGKLYPLESVDEADRDMRVLISFLNHLVQHKGNVWRTLVKSVVGLSEETTSGITAMRKLHKESGLLFPIFSTNDVVSKIKFDNNYGARYSSIHGMCNGAQSFLIGGKEVLVIGYGNVGKGAVMGFSGAGARVKVAEADPICALQAVMDGYDVVLLEDVVETADIFVTTTGSIDIITLEHLKKMKNNAVVGNIGQGDREIQMARLASDPNVEITEVRYNVHLYKFKDTGKGVIILAQGRLYNLGCANGHPSFVMSLSFTTQILSLLELWKNKDSGKFGKEIYTLPKTLDESVARLHLPAMNAKLTKLTQKQADYMGVDVNGPYKHEHYHY
ncbi:adenosylhomocysteinase, putative [Theileria equi strain WA]|uniref:Adenosylhomocysteinase, putative n=1 Tax=Theileria equi strain WA TaxID=1537102 RepID=L1LB08_THEEQ|nr:adenosylhomocysteinase, putative [Theileria equi strain WA]EKX72454.1 adenosylhomocysteinase, putative [Theileria equi strain WA]|eukprot:XP_004831906.1 adenosylhomocysteinase, putative [Theileria equi strain WA]